MMDSQSSEQGRFSTTDRAWPHGRLNGAFRGLGDMEALNERETLGRNFPPSTLLYIAGLVDPRAKVEIEVTAFVPAT